VLTRLPLLIQPAAVPADRNDQLFMARILCVDDELNVVRMNCAILQGAGHDTTSCTSAREAVEELQRNAYDIVVTDWRLGDGNGSAVVQAARTNSNVPVIVVSAYMAEAFQAAEPPADLYLEKPVKPEDLITSVNDVLKSGTCSEKAIAG